MQLSKFMRLIQNEFVKVFAKPIAFIMIILIPIIAFGYGFAMKNILKVQTYNSNQGMSDENYVEDYISNLNSSIMSGDGKYAQQDVSDLKEKMQLAIDIRDGKINVDITSWQMTALFSKVEATAMAESLKEYDAESAAKYLKNADAIQKAVDNDDLGMYLDAQISSLDDQIAALTAEEDASRLKASRDVLVLRKSNNIPPVCTEIKYSYNSDKDLTWQENMISSYLTAKASQYSGRSGDGIMTDDQVSANNDEVTLMEYRLNNNIQEISGDSQFGFVLESASLVSVISIFIIIIAATMMAQEYTSGTIKLLLISPHKRWKIFAAKLVSVFLISLILLVILFASSIITGGILFGFDFSQLWLTVNDGVVSSNHALIPCLLKYLLACPQLLVMTSLAIMFAVIMRHSAVAIGVGIAFMLGGSIVTSILSLMHYDFKKFILFMNTDLSVYFPSLSSSLIKDFTGSNDIVSSMYSGMTFKFSLTVLAVYFICFTYIALDSFNRRDIKQS